MYYGWPIFITIILSTLLIVEQYDTNLCNCGKNTFSVVQFVIGAVSRIHAGFEKNKQSFRTENVLKTFRYLGILMQIIRISPFCRYIILFF